MSRRAEDSGDGDGSCVSLGLGIMDYGVDGRSHTWRKNGEAHCIFCLSGLGNGVWFLDSV